MNPLTDSAELGKRLSAARGYMQLSKEDFAAEIELSVPTIRRYENGTGLEGKSLREREILAEQYLRVTGCPASLLFGDEVPKSLDQSERLSRVEDLLARILDEQESVRIRLAELDEPSDSSLGAASGPRRVERGHGFSNA